MARILKNYNQAIIKLKLLSSISDPHKTALVVTVGICIGIIPLIGVTFVLLTIVGLIFRLNQFILQTVHILVSPFQILFLPLFFKTGQWLFAPVEIQKHQIINSMVPLNFFHLVEQFGNLITYGLFSWGIFCALFGYLLYRFLLIVLSSKFAANQD